MHFNPKLLFIFAIALAACSGDEKKTLTQATGKLGSVIIVGAPQTLKEMKQVIDTTFLSPLPYLVEEEPYFEILKPTPEQFTKFYYNQKSVFVFVKPDDFETLGSLMEPFDAKTAEELCNNPEPVLKSAKNLFAVNQHLVYLFGKDDEDLRRKALKAMDVIRSSLKKYEMEDILARLLKSPQKNDKYAAEMKKELGMSMRIPDMFDLKLHKNGFWWFEYKGLEGEYDKTLGILLHAYPYKDTADFSYASIRSARDSVVKYHIPGESEGSYMGTSESKYYPTRFIEAGQINNNYSTMVRGWWNMWNMSMGGPFVRYVVHNPKNSTLFAFEGFVYKPAVNTKERDLRLFEALSSTIQ